MFWSYRLPVVKQALAAVLETLCITMCVTTSLYNYSVLDLIHIAFYL